MTTTPRPHAQRRADTLAALTRERADCWVATAGPTGAHLVPLSLAWIHERIVLALAADSVTARNAVASGRARIGLGPTRDVVMIDAVLDRAVPCVGTPELGATYTRIAGWDPRGLAGHTFLVLAPERIQAWREADEIAGRTIMRDGRWLT